MSRLDRVRQALAAGRLHELEAEFDYEDAMQKHPAVPDRYPEWVHRMAFQRDELLTERGRLNAELESLRGIPVVGTVGDGGNIHWNGAGQEAAEDRDLTERDETLSEERTNASSYETAGTVSPDRREHRSQGDARPERQRSARDRGPQGNRDSSRRL